MSDSKRDIVAEARDNQKNQNSSAAVDDWAVERGTGSGSGSGATGDRRRSIWERKAAGIANHGGAGGSPFQHTTTLLPPWLREP